MKKFLIALNIVIWSTVAVEAQANAKNLSCDLTIDNGKTKTIQIELQLDPKAMYGVVDGRRASLGNFGDVYTVDTANNGYHFALNRSTLEITDGISFLEGMGFVPDNFTGKCSIVESKNQI